MHVLFEDDGQLKTGAVLADHDASLQVEAASGKRLKVKAGSVLLRFAEPSPLEALAQGQRLAAELDPDFLWEASGEGEFGFDELARDYYGAAAKPVEQIAVAFLLHGAPMYFYKRGKGRYRKAPPDALKAALASVERKAREAAQIEAWAAGLGERRLPDALRAKLPMLLYRPDRNAIEWKALAAACERERMAPLALLAACGAIHSTHDYHFGRFVAEAFPRGLDFPDWGELPALPALPALPEAPVRAFSIDDHTTTEIDDAFSVRELPDGTVEIGIHIAAPALSLAKGSRLDAIARERLSTVYMPGRKITMLPEAVVDAFTLKEGTLRPALSLRVVTTHDGVPLRHETTVAAVPIAVNLRLDEVGGAFANDLPSPADPPWSAELRALWKLARHLNAQRGKTDVERVDYSFYVDWDADSGLGEPGRVAIVPRPRGSPIDRLVSELMIYVNNTWGRLLAERGATGLYRTQGAGKVKMSTRPGEHQGLGLTHYLWASSPLRRYSDLVNQRQLLAVVAGERPPHPENDAELFAALADFEATYGQYAEFQDRMEHYWCLRWLLQERVTATTATVIRDNLVRFDRLPLVMRLADLPDSAPGTLVRVAIGAIDLLAATIECRVAGPATSPEA
ncbi:MAG: ribonuclease II [Betaproteobacteria bacterium]|nr:MAG: ribonuclease II [Betaproteobacteria bacterium]